MYLLNLIRAWLANSLIQLGYSIAPDFYLEDMFQQQNGEENGK